MTIQPDTILRVKLFFAFYDLWIGAYWDSPSRTLYICLLPCIVLKVWREPRPNNRTHFKAALAAIMRLTHTPGDQASMDVLSQIRDEAERWRHYVEMTGKGYDCK